MQLIALKIIINKLSIFVSYFFRQNGQPETRNAADNEDSFTKQQFDIIQQIMHHTQQQIATSTVSKNSNMKNSSNSKNWNSQQVKIKFSILLNIKNIIKVVEINHFIFMCVVCSNKYLSIFVNINLIYFRVMVHF